MRAIAHSAKVATLPLPRTEPYHDEKVQSSYSVCESIIPTSRLACSSPRCQSLYGSGRGLQWLVRCSQNRARKLLWVVVQKCMSPQANARPHQHTSASRPLLFDLRRACLRCIDLYRWPRELCSSFENECPGKLSIWYTRHIAMLHGPY